MANVVTLADAKKHLNLESDFTADDAYITSLIEVAEQAVEAHVNVAFEQLAEDGGGTLPAPVRQAVLLMVGNLYQHREVMGSVNELELPRAYDYLIDLYRNYN